MKKQEILDYLKSHPGWVLQYVRGVGGDWWWLRNGPGPEVICVDGRGAKAASKHLKIVGNNWQQTSYA